MAEVQDEDGPVVRGVMAFGFDLEGTWTIAVPPSELEALVAAHGPLRAQELVELEVSAQDTLPRITERPESSSGR